jgi:hypothetical protein
MESDDKNKKKQWSKRRKEELLYSFTLKYN